MNAQVEKAARTFVLGIVPKYGISSSLARARRLRWEYPQRRVPQWLQRSITLLIAMDEKQWAIWHCHMCGQPNLGEEKACYDCLTPREDDK